MQQHLQEALAAEFPFLYRGPYMEEQRQQWGNICDLYGAFGLDVGDGWYQLLRDMCAEITSAYEAEGTPVDIVVDQVKEKFGTLRFYYHHEGQDIKIHALDSLSTGVSLRFWPGASELQKEVARIIAAYEEKSGHICEVCGQPGSLRTDLSWMLTLCEEHYLPRKPEARKKKGEGLP